MNRIRILPVALAVALVTAGGVSHALARPGDRDDHPGMGDPRPSMTATSTQMAARTQGAIPNHGRAKVSLDAAEKMALDKVGGGKVMKAVRFGFGERMYKFDIKNGNRTKRVYVDGDTGKLTIAASLDPGFDPSVIGHNSLSHNDTEHHG